MSSDLRAAAELYQQCRFDEIQEIGWKDADALCDDLSKAYLATHHADDGEVCTYDWARETWPSISFAPSFHGQNWLANFYHNGGYIRFNCVLRRGQLRRLIAALRGEG